MNRFSALAKLADSMLTTPSLPTWGSAPARVPASTPVPTPAGPLAGWSWGS